MEHHSSENRKAVQVPKQFDKIFKFIVNSIDFCNTKTPRTTSSLKTSIACVQTQNENSNVNVFFKFAKLVGVGNFKGL